MGFLQRLRQDLPRRGMIVRARMGKDLLGPDTWQYGRKLVPPAPGIFPVSAIGCELVRIASTADTHVDSPVAEEIQRGHARRNVQRVVDRCQYDPETEAQAGGALTDRCQGQVRCAVMRPFRSEVML